MKYFIEWHIKIIQDSRRKIYLEYFEAKMGINIKTRQIFEPDDLQKYWLSLLEFTINV